MSLRNFIPVGTRRRRAGVYITVLGTATAITVIGLSSLTVARIERRWMKAGSDFAQSRIYAESAIEFGLLKIDQNANWRTTYVSGVWESNKVIGNGRFTLEGIDADGLLADSATDGLTLRGTGMEGSAQFKLEVQVDADITPLTCLERPLHVGNDVTFSGADVTSDRPISANKNMAAVASTINADAEAGGTIIGLGFQGSRVTGMIARTMPSASVFDYYIANGTVINFDSTGGKIEDTVLSPRRNPYGVATNPQGIYVISCGGRDFTIRDCRILGTLVLLDVGGSSRVENSVNIEPAVANLPSLLVRGKMEFRYDDAPLSESDREVNFNPPESGYRGISDNDQIDSYPSIIRGLVYVSSELTFDGAPTFDGVVVGGNNLSIEKQAVFTYQSHYFANPPPGFIAAPRMVVVEGTWRQVVD